MNESVSESVSEPVSESVNESVSEPVSESVNESVSEPVSESVNESVSEPVSESVSEPVSESVNESENVSVSQAVRPFIHSLHSLHSLHSMSFHFISCHSFMIHQNHHHQLAGLTPCGVQICSDRCAHRSLQAPHTPSDLAEESTFAWYHPPKKKCKGRRMSLLKLL